MWYAQCNFCSVSYSRNLVIIVVTSSACRCKASCCCTVEEASGALTSAPCTFNSCDFLSQPVCTFNNRDFSHSQSGSPPNTAFMPIQTEHTTSQSPLPHAARHYCTLCTQQRTLEKCIFSETVELPPVEAFKRSFVPWRTPNQLLNIFFILLQSTTALPKTNDGFEQFHHRPLKSIIQVQR